MDIIRKFRKEDAKEISELVIRTLLETNSRDYPSQMIEELILREQPGDQIRLSESAHFYVAESDGKLIGCGAVRPGKRPEAPCTFHTVFVLPEHQGRGIGRRIMETLEQDVYAETAGRIELHASITGLSFYRKLGYEYMDGCREPDENLLFRLTRNLSGKRPEAPALS